MNVIVIGFKMAGKTVVGRALAKKLSLCFLDTDEEICKKAKENTPYEIAQKQWMLFFRNLEDWYVASLTGIDNTVIATGGGMILRKKTRQALKTLGKIVFLDGSKELLRKRIFANPPSIFTDNGKRFFYQEYAARRKLYLEIADITISIDGKTIEQIADEIGEKLSGK